MPIRTLQAISIASCGPRVLSRHVLPVADQRNSLVPILFNSCATESRFVKITRIAASPSRIGSRGDEVEIPRLETDPNLHILLLQTRTPYIHIHMYSSKMEICANSIHF